MCLQGASKGLEQWVQRSAERAVALEVAMKATDRRNAELEARISVLNKSLHAAEARSRADQEEKDALLNTIRSLRTQAALSGSGSSVHRAATAVEAALAGAQSSTSDGHTSQAWPDVHDRLSKLLIEVCAD